MSLIIVYNTSIQWFLKSSCAHRVERATVSCFQWLWLWSRLWSPWKRWKIIINIRPCPQSGTSSATFFFLLLRNLRGMGRKKTPCTMHWKQKPGDCGEHSAHRVWKITPRDLVVTQVLQHLASVPENIINVSLCVRVLFLLHEASVEEKVGEVDVADHYDQVENLAHQELKWNTFIFTS